jgi:hypothetical protein
MSRLSVILFILVIVSGMTNFIVKQNVQRLDDQLNATRRKTAVEQKTIHELTADWTALNQPELLADLNNRYLHLAAVSPKQVVTNLDGIPLRPASPPPEAAPQIAAVTEPAPVSAPIPAAMPIPTAPQSRPPVVPVSVPVPARAPALPLSMIATAHAATVHAATEPVAPPPRPAKPASLDGLFAQVAGER